MNGVARMPKGLKMPRQQVSEDRMSGGVRVLELIFQKIGSQCSCLPDNQQVVLVQLALSNSSEDIGISRLIWMFKSD